MRHILIIFSVFLFSFTIISCNKKSSTSSSASDDTTAPVIAEVTPVPNQISNSAPEYTFSSTEEGTIIYGAPSFDFPESNPYGESPYLLMGRIFVEGVEGGVSI